MQQSPILGEGTVEVGGHPDIVHDVVPIRAHAGAHQHPLAEEWRSRFALTAVDSNNAPTTIGALNEGKRSRLVPAAIGFLLGGVFLDIDRISVPAVTLEEYQPRRVLFPYC